MAADPAPAQEAPAEAPPTGVGECTTKRMTISVCNRLLQESRQNGRQLAKQLVDVALC